MDFLMVILKLKLISSRLNEPYYTGNWIARELFLIHSLKRWAIKNIAESMNELKVALKKIYVYIF